MKRPCLNRNFPAVTLTAFLSLFHGSSAFGIDIGISEAEEIAEKNNAGIRALRLEEQATLIQERSRFRDFFPSLNVSYRRNRTIAQRDYDTGNNSLQLSVSQPLYDGGRTSLAHDVARIDTILSRERIEETRRQLQLRVQQSYFEIIQAEQNIRIVEASVKSYALLHSISGIERKNGNLALIEFLQIKNQHEQRLQDLQTQNDLLAAKMDGFRLLLRIPANEQIFLRPVDLRQIGTEDLRFDPASLTQKALERRPDIKQARMDLLKGQREYLISQVHWLPTISLTGNYGKTGIDWPPNRAEWGLGINVTFNIFGNTINSDYRYLNSASDTSRGYSTGGSASLFDRPNWDETHLRNSINLLRSKDRREELEQSIRNQIRSMHAEYIRRKKGLAILDEATALQEKKQHLTEFQYRHGEVSFDEYLKQEVKLFESRFSLVSERIALLLLIRQMELALGLPIGGLGELPIREIPRSSKEGLDDIWRPRTALPENDDIPELRVPEDGP